MDRRDQAPGGSSEAMSFIDWHLVFIGWAPRYYYWTTRRSVRGADFPRALTWWRHRVRPSVQPPPPPPRPGNGAKLHTDTQPRVPNLPRLQAERGKRKNPSLAQQRPGGNVAPPLRGPARDSREARRGQAAFRPRFSSSCFRIHCGLAGRRHARAPACLVFHGTLVRRAPLALSACVGVCVSAWYGAQGWEIRGGGGGGGGGGERGGRRPGPGPLLR